MNERESDGQEHARADQIEELYERARSIPPEGRAAFLAEACGADAELESELNSLLAHAEPAEAFFAGLAESIVSPAIGHHVGHYRLDGILGAGGMGTVYRAHDTRLERMVALKFLPAHLSTQPEAQGQLLMEARAAASLDHANVCRIHEIGESADGRPFIAMACYEGETLKARLGRGPLMPAEAVVIAVQLARGLGAAHACGMVHRDVKPGNIMLCADGTVRLLDFGLANVNDATFTGTGGTPGTVAYMSPEQARGDAVNHRTDLWSLGVVLYEMLSGVRPFRGGNDAAVVQAILNQQPEQLPDPVRDAAPSLPRIVLRLLEKSADGRYQSADELLGDLTRAAPAVADGAIERARMRRRRIAMSGVGLVAVALLFTLFKSVHRSATLTSPIGPTSSAPAIAVLPFTVRGAGLEVWREGMVDLLSMGLDGTAGIRAIDSRTLLARWHKEVGDTTTADLALALAVARRSRARYALVGSVVAAGARIRLGADVYDVESGRVVGPVQVEGPSDSVLALVDRLGMQTLGVILQKDPGKIPALDLAAITTSSLIALHAYLEGEDRYRRSEFRGASEAWERAVHADTLFALAYLGLAQAYGWYDEQTDGERYRKNLERARILADRLPAVERMVVQVRWAERGGGLAAIPPIREAVRKYPDAAEAWYTLGEAYYHQAAGMAGPEETQAAFQKAAELQPGMAPYRAHLLELAFLWHPDSAHIASEVERYARLAPQDARSRAGRIGLALGFGDSATRAHARAALGTLDVESATQLYLLLSHPRFAETREAVFSAVEPRLDQRSRRNLRAPQARNVGLFDGRVRYSLEVLNDSPRSSPWYCGPLYLSVRGLPVPERIMAERLAASLADKALFSSRYAVLCAAGYAARQGDWNEYGVLLSGAQKIAARELAAGDSASAREWDGFVLAAEAHGFWRHGRKEEALRAFKGALASGAGWDALWCVAQLDLELGRMDEAERGFRALWNQNGTPAYLQLARILERTGRRDEARDAYQFVVYAWRNADAELQPLVDEARRAVIRLSRVED